MTMAAPTPNDALRAVVVDDEQLARDELCFLLQQLGGVEIVAKAGNGVEALRVIEECQPDLVMLDTASLLRVLARCETTFDRAEIARIENAATSVPDGTAADIVLTPGCRVSVELR